MSDAIRLSKKVIELTGCSRREAELYIEGGWVTVDGAVVEQPQFKVEQQTVSLLPGAVAEAVPAASILLHARDNSAVELNLSQRWELDPSGLRPLHSHLRNLSAELALYPNASGMLILSQDWRTLRKLREDGSKLEQEYLIDITGRTAQTDIARFAKGFHFQGSFLAGKLSWQNEQRLRLAIKQPPAGCIEALCSSLKLTIIAIRRIRIGALAMGKLPEQQWRYLSPKDRV